MLAHDLRLSFFWLFVQFQAFEFDFTSALVTIETMSLKFAKPSDIAHFSSQGILYMPADTRRFVNTAITQYWGYGPRMPSGTKKDSICPYYSHIISYTLSL